MLIKKYFSQITSIMITCILLIYAFMHKSIFLLNVEYPYVWIGTEILLLAGILFFPFLKEKKNKYTTTAIFLLAPLLMIVAVEMLNGNMLWDIDMFGNVCMNYFIAFLLYLLIYAASGSTKCSIISISILLEVFGIANYYVKLYKGSPLLPWDLSAITTAANVSDAFSFNPY